VNIDTILSVVYMVSEYEEGYGDHVTLLIDFNQNILHFHGAKILK